ncbi:MAG TPA: phosphoribosylanthranilate isomerase [Bacteroidales bacterium]|nr:phosphoribosylanthranilate isomerase [Bacteroidales bacterium]
MNSLIKICGTKDPDNIREVVALQPDLLGFIFYSKSPRYIGKNPDFALFREIPSGIGKTGVFVNTEPEAVLIQSKKLELDFVQLHGEESPNDCRILTHNGLQVIKAFQINSSFRFELLKQYAPFCRFFLFDTPTSTYGGSGKQFNWSVLDYYEGPVPFFLSGGIGPEDAGKLTGFSHPFLAGVDVNSRFETSPGIKDIAQLKKFIHIIRQRI